MSWSGREQNCCFLNTGNGRFANVSAAAGLDQVEDGRAYALVDWDHDGDLDVWLTNRSAPRVRFLRNDTASGNHFLAIRLVGNGNTTNRDAIGARVELLLKERTEEKLIQTLRAGEGFLGQSSKWLHFGLGSATEIEKLIVRWPGGQAEEFTGLEADRHWRLVQGSGAAESWTPPARVLQLAAAEPDLPRATERAAILLPRRLPLPDLEYERLDADKDTLRRHLGSPVLLTLWASWCHPCVKELAQFAENKAELEAARLRVVALSVDGVNGDDPNAQQAARDLLARLNFPFTAGWANTALLEKLQVVHDMLFGLRRQLPVPTSLLIDGRGRLAAIYKGPVEVERLLADVGKLPLEGKALLRAALPFKGRWVSRPDEQPRLVPIVNRLLRQGYVEDLVPYIAEHHAIMAADPKFPDLLVVAGNELLKRNQPEAAAEQLLAAIQLRPDADAHNNLGLVYFRQGKLPEAAEHFESALQLKPDLVEAYANLGRVRAGQGDLPAAAAQFARALEVQPEFAEAHRMLGVISLRQGKLDDAFHSFQRTLELKPDWAQAHYHLGEVAQRQQKLEEAAGHLERAIAADADHAPAHFLLAVVWNRQMKLAEALDEARQVLRINPENVEAHYLLGQTLQRQERVAEAAAAFERVIQLKPEHAGARHRLGFLRQREGRLGEAIKQYQEVLRLAPQNIAVANSLAWILATGSDPELRNGQQALEWARKCAEATKHQQPGVLATLAAACAETGQFDEAVRWQTKAIELAPKAAQPELRNVLQLYQARQPYREKER